MPSRARPVLLACSVSLSISLVPLLAEAGRDRGSSGGGGRLGQVSSGLGNATGGGSRGGSSGGGGDTPVVRDHRDYHDHRDTVEPVYITPVYVEGASGAPDPSGPSRPSTISFDLYAGAQKVYDSDGSLSLELAINEGRFRIGGSLTRYYEQQDVGDALTLTLPSLYLGVRIDDGGRTRVYLEGGAVGAKTKNDPVMDSSVAGVLGGVRVEHRASRSLSFVGDAQVMLFEEDVRAGAMRAGVRLGYLQATLRYLDLNVGPALFGPEIGFAF